MCACQITNAIEIALLKKLFDSKGEIKLKSGASLPDNSTAGEFQLISHKTIRTKEIVTKVNGLFDLKGLISIER